MRVDGSAALVATVLPLPPPNRDTAASYFDAELSGGGGEMADRSESYVCLPSSFPHSSRPLSVRSNLTVPVTAV
ncbi:hypothetical protein J6590_037749 [Homalodisca vitripennis]|nr:hypothetical protein J6590_037749 [Homalodisca vitripennis]